jgi:hypothetical protein
MHNVFLAMDLVFRSPEYPMQLGHRVELSDVKIEITELREDGRAAEATFTFAHPLEDAHFLWIRWGGDHFNLAQPPVIGERIVLPASE